MSVHVLLENDSCYYQWEILYIIMVGNRENNENIKEIRASSKRLPPFLFLLFFNFVSLNM